MIKLGLKNYFKSYRFFFVPLGALSLGIVLGLSIMIPWIVEAIKAFVAGVAALLGQVSWDWNAVKDVLIAELQSFDWGDIDGVIAQVTGDGYLGDLLQRCAEAALGDISSVKEGFDALLSETMGKMAAAFAVGIFFFFVGAVVGYIVTRSQIRNDVAKRSFWKWILVSIADAIIKVTVLAFGLWLISKAKSYAILAFLLTVILYGAISFFEAYLVHGWKKVPLKDVLNVKNFFGLFLLTLIEFAIAAIFVTLACAITNAVVGLYVGFAIFVLTIVCVQLNAESYVKKLAEMSENSGESNSVDPAVEEPSDPSETQEEEQPSEKEGSENFFSEESDQ